MQNPVVKRGYIEDYGNCVKMGSIDGSTPQVSTVLLNWNRLHLLKKTISSYLATVSVPYELVIVDNGSSDGSREYILDFCKENPQHRAILLTRNLGGEALNLGLSLTQAQFLHISENDIEYLPGWDSQLLSKFNTFPELGQLSLFAPSPQKEKGEIWAEHKAELLTKDGQTIHPTQGNVGSSSIFRRDIWNKGVRWTSIRPHPQSEYAFPADGLFSPEVRKLGYLCAWNDKYTVINWGHNVHEWKDHLQYYLENYRNKPWLMEEGMKKRLLENGYDLVKNEGQYNIVKV